jgi:hypothetical protein
MKPVLLVPHAASLPAVVAGATRAGRDPRVAVVREARELERIVEHGTDGEMVIACLRDGGSLTGQVRPLVSRGARPIPVLTASTTIGVEPASLIWLHELPAGLNVAVPSSDDDLERRRLWDSLRTEGLDERHHLVDVDGQPALAEMVDHGTIPDEDRLRTLAAGAAGVLGGRMVSGNRRWTTALDD